MKYVSVEARFLFFNGVHRYTVEYTYGLAKWFVFKNEEQTNAVHTKEDKKIKLKNINNSSAEDVLYEYLQS